MRAGKTLLQGDLAVMEILESGLVADADHRGVGEFGVEALTDVSLCVFPCKRVWDLFVQMPSLAFEAAWLGSREESMIDENLTSVGQSNAGERIAALVITLYRRPRRSIWSAMTVSSFRCRSSISPTRSACRWSIPARPGRACGGPDFSRRRAGG